MTQQTHYFAKDGSYGDATGLIVIVTEKFTEDDWSMIQDLLGYKDWDYTVEILKLIAKHRGV